MVSAYTTIFAKISGLMILLLVMQSCTGKKIYYKSNCDDSRTFKHIGFSQLMDSLAYYDNQYVEVSGKYQQSKGQSALVNDSSFVDHSAAKSLWVEFSPECPLYLAGTRIGFFDYDYNDGKLTPVNNKVIVIRGKINAGFKGHLGAYKGSIEHISYIKL
ncbi:hypothetical protein HDF18_11605 [Mucilaginibacter sp. X5P1]|uniref:hypothetical protein n=1 Tax=Mucilaginibacter sp. X5P1 TaxID=2723088 RepID=UPI00161A9D85|nr:hypothetical protein [Mucilaginibacter sp. X5P1]MBB6140539.1 hypothetical protein [Mucilaginibacter sp. X5P1]